ncbi:MAG: hypothetical protein JSW58_08695, partial [Candidatus Latescibacterota bacterium]
MGKKKRKKGRPAKGTKSGDRDERLKMAETLWSKGFKKWQIKAALVKEFEISGRLAEDDYHVARARALAEHVEERKELRSHVSELLLQIVRDPTTDDKARVAALKEFSKLHGLHRQPLPDESSIDRVEVDIADWRETIEKAAAEGRLLSADRDQMITKPSPG